MLKLILANIIIFVLIAFIPLELTFSIEICSYDPIYDPVETGGGPMERRGVFTWLAFIQFLHVETGEVNMERMPRAVMVHKQFVLSSAEAIMNVPANHSLGYVVFAEYERDEFECGMTEEQVLLKIPCSRSSMTIPVVDVLVHPEYSSFGRPHSLALVKMLEPLESDFMVPVCMPRFPIDELRQKFLLVDYISSVPDDLEVELKGVKPVRIINGPECAEMLYDEHSTNYTWVAERGFCVRVCGARSGSLITYHHKVVGLWKLIGITLESPRCDEIGDITVFIEVYHYVDWIKNALRGPKSRRFYNSPNDNPFGYDVLRSVGGVGGVRIAGYQTIGTNCDSGSLHNPNILRYDDVLSFVPSSETMISTFLFVGVGPKWLITCIRIKPYVSWRPAIVIEGGTDFNYVNISMNPPLIRKFFTMNVRIWANINMTATTTTISTVKTTTPGLTY